MLCLRLSNFCDVIVILILLPAKLMEFSLSPVFFTESNECTHFIHHYLPTANFLFVLLHHIHIWVPCCWAFLSLCYVCSGFPARSHIRLYRLPMRTPVLSVPRRNCLSEKVKINIYSVSSFLVHYNKLFVLFSTNKGSKNLITKNITSIYYNKKAKPKGWVSL